MYQPCSLCFVFCCGSYLRNTSCLSRYLHLFLLSLNNFMILPFLLSCQFIWNWFLYMLWDRGQKFYELEMTNHASITYWKLQRFLVVEISIIHHAHNCVGFFEKGFLRFIFFLIFFWALWQYCNLLTQISLVLISDIW